MSGTDEIIVLMKRLPHGEFEGDKRWQVAPYSPSSMQSANKLVEWLRKSFGSQPIAFRIVN